MSITSSQDIDKEILLYLSLQDLGRIKRINKKYYSLVEENTFYKEAKKLLKEIPATRIIREYSIDSIKDKGIIYIRREILERKSSNYFLSKKDIRWNNYINNKISDGIAEEDRTSVFIHACKNK